MQSGVWWLFSSSEAAAHLQQACPELNCSGARALATHPRIAERLRLAGWGRVELVPASLKMQADSIKSLS
jgi:uroporphyrinogen-III synthase